MGACFLRKVLAIEKNRYTCNVIPHWLRPAIKEVKKTPIIVLPVFLSCIFTMPQIVMKSLFRNIFIFNQRLPFHFSVVHFQINFNDITNMIIPDHMNMIVQFQSKENISSKDFFIMSALVHFKNVTCVAQVKQMKLTFFNWMRMSYRCVRIPGNLDNSTDQRNLSPVKPSVVWFWDVNVFRFSRWYLVPVLLIQWFNDWHILLTCAVQQSFCLH